MKFVSETPDQSLANHALAGKRIAIVDGSASFRQVLAAYLLVDCPEIEIEEVDPFSQTVGLTGPVYGTTADVLLLGGIASIQDAVATLARMRKRPVYPRIIVLLPVTLAEQSAQVIDAGATGVLFKDALSGKELVATLTDCLRLEPGGSLPLPSSGGLGDFNFIKDAVPVTVKIPGYRCLELLSTNPMAQVFLVESLIDSHRAVVKISTVTRLGGIDSTAEFCERYKFLSLAQGATVVRYLDAGVCSHWPYAVLEYLSGGNLRSRIDSGSYCEASTTEYARLFLKMAQATETLHRGKLVHLDIKPENIFFRADDELVLIDFNISVFFGQLARSYLTEEIVGTPAYMSPEQGKGLAVDGRSDLYSIGANFFEVLSGEKPYPAKSDIEVIFRHIHDEIPLLPRRVRDFQPIIDRLMAKDPEERYADVNELIAALQPLLHRPF